MVATVKTPSKSRFVVRKFRSSKDIESIDGFVKNNPLTVDNYAKPIGDYLFNADNWVDCCIEKPNGNLCKKSHGYGFVIRLKDGTATIIGNDCAARHFDLDSEILSDIAAYEKEEKRLGRIDTLQSLILGKSEREIRAEGYKERALQIINEVKPFREACGEQSSRAIAEMIKNDRYLVTVKGIQKKIDVNNPENAPEIIHHEHSIGNLKGLKVLKNEYLRSIVIGVNQLKKDYVSVPSNIEELSTVALNKHTKALQKIDIIKNQIDEAEREYAQFIENDFSKFCYLASSGNERQSLMIYHRSTIENPESSVVGNPAQRDLSKMDAHWKELLRLDELRL